MDSLLIGFFLVILGIVLYIAIGCILFVLLASLVVISKYKPWLSFFNDKELVQIFFKTNSFNDTSYEYDDAGFAVFSIFWIILFPIALCYVIVMWPFRMIFKKDSNENFAQYVERKFRQNHVRIK